MIVKNVGMDCIAFRIMVVMIVIAERRPFAVQCSSGPVCIAVAAPAFLKNCYGYSVLYY